MASSGVGMPSSSVASSNPSEWVDNQAQKHRDLAWTYTCGPGALSKASERHWARLHKTYKEVLPKPGGDIETFTARVEHQSDAELAKKVLASGVSQPRRRPFDQPLRAGAAGGGAVAAPGGGGLPPVNGGGPRQPTPPGAMSRSELIRRYRLVPPLPRKPNGATATAGRRAATGAAARPGGSRGSSTVGGPPGLGRSGGSRDSDSVFSTTTVATGSRIGAIPSASAVQGLAAVSGGSAAAASAGSHLEVGADGQRLSSADRRGRQEKDVVFRQARADMMSYKKRDFGGDGVATLLGIGEENRQANSRLAEEGRRCVEEERQRRLAMDGRASDCGAGTSVSGVERETPVEVSVARMRTGGYAGAGNAGSIGARRFGGPGTGVSAATGATSLTELHRRLGEAEEQSADAQGQLRKELRRLHKLENSIARAARGTGDDEASTTVSAA